MDNISRTLSVIISVILLSGLARLSAANPIVKQQDSFYFDPAPVNQDVTEGEDVRLRCDVSNRKLISFYWTLNGRQITNTSRRFQEGSDLRILWVDRDQDSGSLRCIATNMSTGIALRSNEARLSIFWISKTSEVQLKQPKESIEIVENSEVFLRCNVDGNPEPTVEWFRNKARLFPTERIKPMKNRLRIGNTTASDAGVFSCRARNVVGQVDSLDSFVLSIPGPDYPTIQVGSFSSALIAKRLNNALLNCEFKGAARTEWHFGTRNLTNIIDSKYMHWRNGSLTVTRVESTDAGSYSCTGISTSGLRRVFVVELLLAYLEEMKEESFEPRPARPQVVPVNGRYTVLCRPPKGLPPPVVRWRNPYNVLLTGSMDRVSADEGILSLTEVDEADAGTYTCEAENLSGMQSRTIPVLVSVPPKIGRPPLSMRVAEGESASFDCRIQGSPHPVTVIAWNFDEKPLDTTSGRMKVDQVTGSLQISDVQAPDEGNYACVVQTDGHPALVSPSAHLYVERRLRFSQVPVNTKLELGKPGKIPCLAVGHGRPLVHWVRDGLSSLPPHVRSTDGNLVFDSVESDDSGDYTCVATSDQGSITAKIRVDVVVKPWFRVRPSNATVVVGQTVVVNCVIMVIGDQTPLANDWDKDSKKVHDIDPNRFKVLANGSMVVSNARVEDSGRYGCSGENNEGLTRAEVYLRVKSEEEAAVEDLESGVADKKEYLSRTVIIALSSGLVYLTVVVGLAIYCAVRITRAKKLQSSNQRENTSEQTGLMSSVDPSVKFQTIHRTQGEGGGGTSESGSAGSNSRLTFNGGPLWTSPDRTPLHRNQIQNIGMIGKGQFGDVLMAKAFRIMNGNRVTAEETLAMVKSITCKDEPTLKEIRSEVEMYAKANHPRIVKFLGICTDCEPILAVFEYSEWGNLNQFLQTADREGGSGVRLTSIQRLTMCLQVAEGMEHLSNLGFVHKDLATRNVLISPANDLKISSLGLCQGPFSAEYYPLRQELVPLRWMAPEAVVRRELTVASDVWSYGVFVWEVFSGACLPFEGMTDEEVLRSARAGENRLGRPMGCPEDAWRVATRCCQLVPAERPNFTGVASLVSAILVDGSV